MLRILLVTGALVTLASVLADCASASSELISPGVWQVDCRRSSGNCYREAHRVCPHGYDPVGGANRTGYLLTGGVAMPAYRGELIVRCHRPPAQ